MKTSHLASLILALGLSACGGGDPANPQAAEFVQSDALSASSRTTAASGIVSWELQKSELGSRTIGRSIQGEVLADILTTADTHACPDDGGAVVTTTTTVPTKGSQSMGCGGLVLADSLDAKSHEVVELLLQDFEEAASPPPSSSESSGELSGVYEYCVPHTDTKCTGLVYWCKNTYQDCSTDTWHPCGACFGWKW